MLTDEEFADFVQSRGPALLRTACFLSGSRQDGEDLLQQTLVSVFASFRRIREPVALGAYVRTSMARASISARRKPWRRHEWSTEIVPDAVGPVEAASVHDRGQLLPMLRLLSPQPRAVMVLRYYEDRSEAEIARQLGCSPGTVKRHASRAIESLRRQLANETKSTATDGETA